MQQALHGAERVLLPLRRAACKSEEERVPLGRHPKKAESDMRLQPALLGSVSLRQTRNLQQCATNEYVAANAKSRPVRQLTASLDLW